MSKIRRKELSFRELQIIQLIANGLTSKRIAEKLELSVFTVQTHRRNILKKLGFNSSQQLISWAYQKRILTVG